MKAVKGQWVQILAEVLSPSNRAENIPEDTKKVPYVMRVKGYLEDSEASIGDAVTIKTVIGRRLDGELIQIEPSYTHDFGSHVPELSDAGQMISALYRSLKEEGHSDG
ncbi:MAG TPA: 2-amino-4-ketopentanoate thiolase [Kosmotogaceae bacterium]|nr:MAG: Uncharacterized protein XE05_0062 [Thermotogales bacterium 46_20]HAA84797.1 2-amino-4-ketopentanoate thiolase [Kosmotogaceae bacterium]